MKSTDTNIEEFGTVFNDDNTLITNLGDDLSKTIKPELAKLNAAGKTVVITDSYLYHSNNNESYIVAVIDVLKSLKASKIIFATRHKVQDENMEKRVIAALKSQNCSYETKQSKMHDRYWLCLENGRAIHIGTSLNGIGTAVSRISLLTDEEVTALKKNMQAQSII
jgi:hypothetical protein